MQIMTFQAIFYIYVAVLVVAYVSGWVAHLIGGGPNEHLSGVSWMARPRLR